MVTECIMLSSSESFEDNMLTRPATSYWIDKLFVDVNGFKMGQSFRIRHSQHPEWIQPKIDNKVIWPCNRIELFYDINKEHVFRDVESIKVVYKPSYKIPYLEIKLKTVV